MAGRDRRTKTKRIIAPAIILVILVLAIAGVIFVNCFFTIKTVTITGSSKYTYNQLYEYIFEKRNDKNLVLFLISDKRAPKVEIPFIAKTEVEVKFPGTINVTVYEKSIMFYVEYKGTYMYVDKDGVVAESSGELLDGIMRVDGLGYDTIVINEPLKVADSSVFGDITDIIQHLDNNKVPVDSIVVEDGGYSVMMGTVKVLLGDNNFYMAERIFKLSCMLDKLSGLKGTLYLDSYVGNDSGIIFKQE